MLVFTSIDHIRTPLLDLGPRDDLESLAYVLLFLQRGSLPWRLPDSAPNESVLAAQARVLATKRAFDPDHDAAGGFPGELLRYARRLRYGEIPEYDHLRAQLTESVPSAVELGALDWTPVPAQVFPLKADAAVTQDDEGNDSDMGSDEEPDEEYSNSYYGLDIDCWDNYAPRDKDVTLPAELTEMLDGLVPVIEEIVENSG